MSDDKKIKYPSWDEMLSMKSGTTLRDWDEDGVRCLIKRSHASITAYIGVPSGHPLSNYGYEDMPISVHGGLTYAAEGDGDFFPKGFYWYGWDYANCNDYAFYYDEYPLAGEYNHDDDKKWLGEEVEQEVKHAAWDFKKLMDLAEKTGKYIHLD